MSNPSGCDQESELPPPGNRSGRGAQSVLPYLTGLMGEAEGQRASFTLIPISLVLMLLLFRVTLHRITPKPSEARTA